MPRRQESDRIPAMEILIATNNKHKVIEFCRIFSGFRVLSPADMHIDFEFEETGDTFFANSYGKALALHKQTGKWVVADDSGLCVPALDNAPGVYSARYGAPRKGKNLSAARRNQYLLQQMQNITERKAFFACCMVLVMTEHKFFAAQETVEGVIASEPAGSEGFGYDPLFYLSSMGKTVAQLEAGEKDKLSHRGRAARVIRHHLETLQATT